MAKTSTDKTYEGGETLVRPETMRFTGNDWVPNNAGLPVLRYRDVYHENDLASAFEALFSGNGWTPQWRDGIYNYHHYHSTAHEVLGIAEGSAGLVLGGSGGREVTVKRGDVVLLPTGTGHYCRSASADFLVVGAYPAGQDWDICRKAPTAEMIARMDKLPFPAADPVNGTAHPLTECWSKP
jgi:uncharacterized protein YjlB